MSVTWDNNGIFATSLLILYCSFSSLILSFIAIVIFGIVSKGLRLKLKGLSNSRALSVTKKKNVLQCHLGKDS